MRRLVALAFVALVATLLRTPAVATAAEAEVRTAHLRVRGDLDARELARYGALAEACWGAWRAYFREDPKAADLPFLLDVRRDRAGFEEALGRAGVDRRAVATAGGYYDPGSRTSYLFLQPHDSSTRLLVLHELTHQWHAKVWMKNDLGPSPLWHKEGIAEWFGYHRRTKDGLEVGALDMVAIDARPTACAERLAAPDADPWGVLVGSAPRADYTDALAWVAAFQRTPDREVKAAYRRFEAALSSGGDPRSKAEREFGPRKARVLAALRQTWEGFRRPWQVVYIAWDEEDGAIVAKGAPWALLQGTAPLPRDRVSVEATIVLDGPTAASGMVALGVKGPDDLVGAEVRADGAVVLRRKTRGVWWDLGRSEVPVPRLRDGVALRLSASGPRLRVEVGGGLPFEVDGAAAGLTSSDVEGTAALAAVGGPVRFVGVRTGG